MTWKIKQVRHNPLQNSYVLVNDNRAASVTTDYQKADKLARDTFGPVSLSSKYYDLGGHAVRVYASQAY